MIFSCKQPAKAIITVVVPVYKVEPYLRQCIDSILNQTYEDLEVLLIDDGSPDICGQICEKYAAIDSRIKVFHTENKGLSSARNTGLQEAKGEYIGFVDSDDWIEPEMYQNLVQYMKGTNADICVCGYLEENGLSTIKRQFADVTYSNTEALNALLEEKINSNVWNKLYRRELFQSIRFPDGKNYEDIAIIHDLLYLSKRVTVVSDHQYHYRVRQESITKTYSASNLIDFADAYLRRYCFYRDEVNELFIENQEELLRFAAKGISRVWRWWYKCDQTDKQKYETRIKEMKRFSKEHFPLLGYRSWPTYLRLSMPFMNSSSKASFAFLYGLNQLYRNVWPEQGNIILNE